MTTNAKPTIHSNGSSPEVMGNAYYEAYDALREAMEYLQKTCPHGRDYYPQDNGAVCGSNYIKAREEHKERMLALDAIMKDMIVLYKHVRKENDNG